MLLVSTLLSISEHLGVYLLCLLIAGLIAVGLNYIFLRRYFSGLISLQISFAFNAAIILFGWATAAVSIARGLHFFLYQLLVVVGIYWVYRNILQHRVALLSRLHRLTVSTLSAILLLFNLALFGLFLGVVVQNEGGSRIEFMTAFWFSFVRPAMSIVTPLSFFVPFYLFDRGHRLWPALILASSVLCNVASGSKASFVFAMIASVLLCRDLKGSRLAVPQGMKLALVLVTSLSALLALQRLDVNLAALGQRFVRFGESTIMVYYSDNSSAAASGVSTLAKIHRGGAKLLGDASAADIDTIFGFALSREDNGAHNFTGPNAQVSSYMFCNYSGWENLIGIASILGYLAVLQRFLKGLISRQAPGSVLILPFLVASLSNFLQDYYQGMSDVTLIVMVGLAHAAIGITKFACGNVESLDGGQ
jgi:hypothetical protein